MTNDSMTNDFDICHFAICHCLRSFLRITNLIPLSLSETEHVLLSTNPAARPSGIRSVWLRYPIPLALRQPFLAVNTQMPPFGTIAAGSSASVSVISSTVFGQ